MPLATLAATISASGISAPSYSQILQSLQESFKTIYGSDAYIDPDSQDGQLLAIFAKAIDDANQMAVKVFSAFSPTYAQGVELSSVVKINGIRRLVATKSSAVGNVVGVSGTNITNGSVKDENGNIWLLPLSVTIPLGGTIAVTVTAQNAGAVAADTGTINVINTPTRGWQSFVSTAPAAIGAPVETDADLRRRQTRSAALFAKTPLAALQASIANLLGVKRVMVYENDTGGADANGLPAHSISAVVEGGDAQSIGNVIGARKTPGAATYGSTSETYTDPDTGINYTIDFYVLATDTIGVALTIKALDGYSTAVLPQIKAAIAQHINSLAIGEDVFYTRIFPPALLVGQPASQYYEVTVLQTKKGAGALGVIDLAIDFNKAATNNGDTDIVITVV